MCRSAVLLLLLTALVACTKSADTATVQQAQKETLPQDRAKALVVKHCTACHTEQIIIQNRMNAKRWDETITWMQEKQGLWEIPKTERELIVQYLAKHLGQVDVSKQKLPPALPNPLW